MMDATQFQKIAKALADPRRFEILEVIAAAGEEMCCGAVVERFPVAQATVSHHLKELNDAGLIETRTEGQFKYLYARPEVLAEYVSELQSRLPLRSKSQRAAKRSASRRSARA